MKTLRQFLEENLREPGDDEGELMGRVLAERIGITPSTLSMALSGDRPISKFVIKKMAAACSISITELREQVVLPEVKARVDWGNAMPFDDIRELYAAAHRLGILEISMDDLRILLEIRKAVGALNGSLVEGYFQSKA